MSTTVEWLDEATKLRSQGLTYRQISEELGETPRKIEYHLSKNKAVKSKKEKKKAKEVKVNELPILSSEELSKLIVPVIKRAKTLDQIVTKLPKGTTASQVIDTVDYMRSKGFTVDQFDDKFILRTLVTEQPTDVIERNWAGDRVIKFGLVSDAHLNSKYQQLSHLNSFYDLCVEEGIKNVYNAGDLVEGTYLHRAGHIYEIFNHSADDQVDYVIENYPSREGITTYFITGNHDHTHLKNGGYDIGRRIDMERDDMIYLGINEAKIQLTPNCRMDMVHPQDGSSYALSYALQKSIEAMPVDDLPQIYIVGHHHKAIYLHTRGIHALEAGTFQAQTGWMKGKRLAAHVGGWIITLHVDDEGRITRFTPQWIPFSKSIKDDY